MRPLFSDAPVMQAAPSIQAMPTGSQLAAVLARPTTMPTLPPASFGNVPLDSMLKMAMQNNQTPSAQSLLNAPAGQGSIIQGGAPQWSQSTDMPQDPSLLSQITPQMPGSFGVTNPNAGSMPMNYQPPGAPSGLAPGMSAPGAPGTPSGQTPGMPSGQAPGVPTAGTPGPMGMIPTIYGNIYGMGGGGG